MVQHYESALCDGHTKCAHLPAEEAWVASWQAQAALPGVLAMLLAPHPPRRFAQGLNSLCGSLTQLCCASYSSCSG